MTVDNSEKRDSDSDRDVMVDASASCHFRYQTLELGTVPRLSLSTRKVYYLSTNKQMEDTTTDRLMHVPPSILYFPVTLYQTSLHHGLRLPTPQSCHISISYGMVPLSLVAGKLPRTLSRIPTPGSLLFHSSGPWTPSHHA